MKKILLSLFMVLAISLITKAETLTITVGDNLTSNSGSFLDGAISLSTEKNSSSNVPAYNANSKQLRFYYHNTGNGGSATFTTDGSIVITGIKLTAVTNYTPIVKYNIDGGDDIEGTWNETTMEISDFEAKESFEFRNANTSNTQLRITKIEITYTPAKTKVLKTPKFSVASGEITIGTSIEITCDDDNAKIYYTIDGTEPSADKGTLYNEAFTLAENSTVQAIAIDPTGVFSPSAVATAKYTFPATNIAEFIENANDYVSTISGTVTVVAQVGQYLFIQDDSGKIIIYGDVKKTYQNGNQLTGIKGTWAPYFGLPELKPSGELSDAVTGTPIEPKTITLSQVQETELLTYVKIEGVDIPSSNTSNIITDATSSVTMYNSAGIDISVGKNLTIYGFISCYNDTKQLLPIEIISASGLDVLDMPVINPNGGTINQSQEISITCAIEDVSIYYTTDGTEPNTENGTLYTAPFTLDEECTVKAIAVKEGYADSAVAEALFTFASTTATSVTFDFTKPSSLNPTQEVPALGSSSGVAVNDVTFTSGNISISFDKGKATTDCRIWAGTSSYELRTYKNSTMTITVTDAAITSIVFAGSKATTTQMTADNGTFTNNTWTGDSQTIVFSTIATTNIETISVTYDTATGIEDAMIVADAPVEYYNLQGVKVANPENGIFIKRQGGKAIKVVL